MKIKIHFFIFLAIFSSSIYSMNENNNNYFINYGLFKGETTSIKKIVDLTLKNMSEETQIYDIVLHRMALLEPDSKKSFAEILKGIRSSENQKKKSSQDPYNKKELFDALPSSIKSDPLCLCVIDGEEYYIDKNFLEKKD